MKYALIIVLNDVDYLDEIISNFANIGVNGATILDSQGMANAVLDSNNHHMPLFGSLKNLLGESYPYSKTIFTVLEEENVDLTAEIVRKILSKSHLYGAGFIFSIPIGKTYPIYKD